MSSGFRCASPSSSVLGREYWDFQANYPSTLFHQKFGDNLDIDKILERRRMSSPSSMHREFLTKRSSFFRSELNSSGTSTVKNNPSQFDIFLDCSHFQHEEISVRIADNQLIVHCCHEEKPDEHGVVKREFTRKYPLPLGADVDRVVSYVDPQGILAIKVPKHDEDKKPTNERLITIRRGDNDNSDKTDPKTAHK
ncbi:Protein lethal(2)essential for life [Halotydeus destructor]|nr:Protein lethal(2)essential for life [Halotydeus destructor]